MRSLLLLGASLLILSGCSGRGTVSENQCTAGDWQTLGYRDGVNGHRSSRLLEHQDACVRHGIVPDRDDYMAGWEQGVREYCTPNNAFDVGERGWGHDNVCPADQRTDFLAAYREGRSLYLARVEVANLERELDYKTARLGELKSAVVNTAAAQLNGDLTPAERIDLATEVQRLHEEKGRIEAELPDIEAELAIKRRELDKLSQTLAVTTY
jgi:hypothetical protein